MSLAPHSFGLRHHAITFWVSPEHRKSPKSQPFRVTFESDHHANFTLYGRLRFTRPHLIVRLNGVQGPLRGRVDHVGEIRFDRIDIPVAYNALPGWCAAGRINGSDVLLFPLVPTSARQNFYRVLESYGSADDPEAALSACTARYHAVVLPPVS